GEHAARNAEVGAVRLLALDVDADLALPRHRHERDAVGMRQAEAQRRGTVVVAKERLIVGVHAQIEGRWGSMQIARENRAQRAARDDPAIAVAIEAKAQRALALGGAERRGERGEARGRYVEVNAPDVNFTR